MTRRPVTVAITVPARHDLFGIYKRRLAQRGPDGDDGAEALLDRLVAAIEGLSTFPERGPIPPELEELGIRVYRQLSVPPYRIVYRPHLDEAAGRTVTVMIVADGRRDFSKLLEERLLR